MTVAVIDADDRADSDTLFVYVNEAGPTVALGGETEPPTGEETPYLATAGRSTHSLTFTEVKTRHLEVIVQDAENRTDSALLLVDPQEPGRSPDGTDNTDWSPDDSPEGFSAQSSDDSVK